MKTWKLINSIFIGEEDNISGIPKKGDLIKIGEDFSYNYKVPFLQSYKKESIIDTINEIATFYEYSKLTMTDLEKFMLLSSNVLSENVANYEYIDEEHLNDLTDINSPIEDMSEFEMLEIMYNKALEDERQ